MVKPYKKITKNQFEKDFFNLMNNAVFENILENVRKHKEEETIWCQSQIIIVQSLSHKDFLAIEMKKLKHL